MPSVWTERPLLLPLITRTSAPEIAEPEMTSVTRPVNVAVRDAGVGMVRRITPDCVSKVAVISTPPGATALTIPVLPTVATPAFELRQVAVVLTLRDAPSEKTAVAVICASAPTDGTPPATDTLVSVGDCEGDVGATGAGLPSQDESNNAQSSAVTEIGMRREAAAATEPM